MRRGLVGTQGVISHSTPGQGLQVSTGHPASLLISAAKAAGTSLLQQFLSGPAPYLHLGAGPGGEELLGVKHEASHPVRQARVPPHCHPDPSPSSGLGCLWPASLPKKELNRCRQATRLQLGEAAQAPTAA